MISYEEFWENAVCIVFLRKGEQKWFSFLPVIDPQICDRNRSDALKASLFLYADSILKDECQFIWHMAHSQ